MNLIQSLVGATALVATTATAQPVPGSPLPPVEEWGKTVVALHPDLRLSWSESALSVVSTRVQAQGPSRVFTTLIGGHVFYTDAPDAKGVARITAIYSDNYGLCKRVPTLEGLTDGQSGILRSLSAPSYQLNVIGTSVYNTAYLGNRDRELDLAKLVPILPAQSGQKLDGIGADFACLGQYQYTLEASAARRDMGEALRVSRWLQERASDARMAALTNSAPSSAPAPR